MVRIYNASHRSLPRQLRDMRQKARTIIDSKDADTILAGSNVIRLCMDEPHPEYSALHLICAAIDVAKETNRAWHVCMLEILATYERVKEPDNAETETRDQGPSRLRRLLRALIPRSLRARDESASETGEHSRLGGHVEQCSTSSGLAPVDEDRSITAADKESAP
jgi:hypothetical protein